MTDCGCTSLHRPRTIVLTGGPGAGKTAVLELVRHSLCAHVAVLPEAAGMLLGGGFPRVGALAWRQALQRAVFFVQRELESAARAEPLALVLCDRGTVDAAAYWPGPGDVWRELGTSLPEQLARYDAVIHLRTPPRGSGYNQRNPLRTESAEEAQAIDERIAAAWAAHPRRYVVAPAADFLDKAARVIGILHGELPACCRAADAAPERIDDARAVPALARPLHRAAP